jgi:hypothetical protein
MGTGIVTKQISPETENWIFQVKKFPHQLHAKLIPSLLGIYYSVQGEKRPFGCLQCHPHCRKWLKININNLYCIKILWDKQKVRVRM